MSQRVRSGAFTAVLTAGLGLLAWFGLGDQWLTRSSYDRLFYFQPQQQPAEAVIIFMDERAYDSMEQKRHEPWDRKLHAALLDRLRREQAKAVVFDLLFDEASDDPQDDQIFGDALAAQGRAILAGNIEQQMHLGRPIQRLRQPRELLRTNAWGWGLATVFCDPDNVVREFYAGTDEYPSLAWKVAELLGAPVARNPAGRATERWLNYYGPAETLTHISYADISNTVPAGFFRDKVVFVGSRLHTGYGGEERDTFGHPANLGSGEPIPGVEVHATAFLNLLRQDGLRKLPSGVEALLILLGGAALGYCLVLFRPWQALAVCLGIAVLILVSNVIWLRGFHAWFSWLVPVIIQLPVAFTGSVLFHFARVHAEKCVVEYSLAQHLDPSRVKQLLKDPCLRERGGNHVTISILFSDIAHFSKISGRMHPEDLIQLLNQYFETSLGIIHRNQGTVVKLLGDAVFAIWNAPVAQPDHPQKTCVAALQLRDQLSSFNTAQGRLPLRTRIGLHTGLAFVGNVGSEMRFDYTAIGESVNLASRLEGLNKHLGTDILASRDIQKSVENLLVSRPVGYFRLQGFDRVMEVHELIGPRDQAEATRPWRECYAEALHHFHCRAFATAEAGFKKTLDLRPDDHPSEFYLRKIAEFRAQPPPEEWAGEIELTEK
jgi:adenylate cyclase